jgi:hypothetical protein
MSKTVIERRKDKCLGNNVGNWKRKNGNRIMAKIKENI